MICKKGLPTYVGDLLIVDNVLCSEPYFDSFHAPLHIQFFEDVFHMGLYGAGRDE